MVLSPQSLLRLATVYTPYLILQPPQGDKSAGTSEGQGAVLMPKSPCCFQPPFPVPAEGEAAGVREGLACGNEQCWNRKTEDKEWKKYSSKKE